VTWARQLLRAAEAIGVQAHSEVPERGVRQRDKHWFSEETFMDHARKLVITT
jgi:hypothetical protein